MKLYVVARLTHASGNCSTAERIRSLLADRHDVSLLDAGHHATEAAIAATSDGLVIGIHALRVSGVLAGCQLPFLLIFGGTDLNEHARSDEDRAKMEAAVRRARFLIVFNESMKRKALQIWPDIDSKKIQKIPQSVLAAVGKVDIVQLLDSSHFLTTKRSKIFLLVAGIRPVKAPHFLLSRFEEWSRERLNDDVRLVVIGPIMDEAYFLEFQRQIEKCKSATYVAPISNSQLQGALRQAFCVVNSSISEGQSSALLEALRAGTPIIARENDGNHELLASPSHQPLALLYSSAEEFIAHATLLISDRNLALQLAERGRSEYERHYQRETEQESYRKLLEQLTNRA